MAGSTETLNGEGHAEVTTLQPPSSNQVGVNNTVELRLGADLIHLPVIRSLAGSLATRADFDLDSIADLRLAVDEACSTLITSALPESIIECRFVITEDEFRFTATVNSVAGEQPPNPRTFGWRVLAALTDEAQSWVTENGTGNLIHIEVAKKKPSVSP